MVEEKAWRELEAGAERKLANAQNQKLLDQCALNSILLKDSQIRAKNNRDTVQAKLSNSAYEEEFELTFAIVFLQNRRRFWVLAAPCGED